MASIRQFKAVLRGIRLWFNQRSSGVKITAGLIVTALISFSAIFFPQLDPLDYLPTWMRFAFLIFLFISCLWGLAGYWSKGERLEEKEQKVTALEAELKSAKKELERQEKERESLLAMDESIWVRPVQGGNQFLPRDDRKTVIISMLNLKGGVGKTTLTANLGACLATMPKPLRVLIVDLDFQGTLSDMCVDQGVLTVLRQTATISHRLLDEDRAISLLETVAVSLTNVSNAKIVCSGDILDSVNYRLQALFFLDAEKEVRFHYQTIFHDPMIRHHFDVILFDCPPRLTTSSVNALACSDYVLIPTKLDMSSVRAVPRTLSWLARMQQVVQARPVGVIANESILRGGKLIRDHQNAYNYLVSSIPPIYGSIVLENTISFSNRIAHTRTPGVVAATEQDVVAVFDGVAQELRQRIGI